MHDQNFKNLILDYPRESLQFFAEHEAGKELEEARILPIRQEQLKERLGERFRELDVPLLVEWADGSREAVLFILEEETQQRRFSIHRLAHYCLDIAELMQTKRVVPVVIFLGKGQRESELILGGQQYNYLQFPDYLQASAIFKMIIAFNQCQVITVISTSGRNLKRCTINQAPRSLLASG